MTSILKSAILFSFPLILLASCNKAGKLDDTANAIPKNAMSVTAINVPSLMSKADFEAVKQMDFYKAMVDSASAESQTFADILKDPKKSGVDLTKNIYVVQDYNFLTGDGGTSAAVLISLADAKAFETMLKSSKEPVTVESKDGIKFIKRSGKSVSDEGNGMDISTESGFVAWNDKMAVVGGGMAQDTEGVDWSAFFKNKADQSISKNGQFTSLFAEAHDIYTYTSFDKLAETPQMKSGASMLDLSPEALKGNYATGYADFEKGQIVSKSDYKINSEIRKKYGLMFKDNVKTDFSKYLKGQNIGFAMTMALDMKGVKEIINANMQWRMLLEMGKGDTKFSVDDVFKAIDGDMVIAANPTGKDKWEGIMGLKLQDKATMEKLVNALVEEKVLVAEGNGIYAFSGTADMMSNNYSNGYVEKGKVAFVGDVLFAGEANAIATLKSGGSVSADVKDVLNKNIFGIYANFSQIFAHTDEMKDPEFTELKMSMNGTKGDFNMKMRDANENSLKSLMKAVNRWYLKEQTEKAKRTKEREEAQKSEI